VEIFKGLSAHQADSPLNPIPMGVNDLVLFSILPGAENGFADVIVRIAKLAEP
jgi:hypothetical protein